ncbi:MAG: hypothetical protein HOG79_18020 [Prolixibacteraceae bacterium]|nr:hypothetical protein [Prolixibacteraceae bacterium]
MRVFAGPNGSGKSTIINSVRSHKVNGIPVDFGIYVNADLIARDLQKGNISFKKYKIVISQDEFVAISLDSGLIGEKFSEEQFISSFRITRNIIYLTKPAADEYIAQIMAHVLRKKLLQEKKKFSFETVFSHESKVDIMKEAVEAGYKVYLYFVSTKSPEINKYRIKVRVEQGGHPVPEDKIVNRYYRSMDLLHEASQYSYQAFYFDNSENGVGKQSMFAHFKLDKDRHKKWDKIDQGIVPDWFFKYYSSKNI